MMNIEPFYDPNTYTLTYVVYDSKTKDAVVIDPVLDYKPIGSLLSNDSYTSIKEFLLKESLNLHYVLETHAHADHLSSSQLFKLDFPKSKVAISEHIQEVQKTFKEVYNLKEDFKIDGSQFDLLLQDKEILEAGSLQIEVIATPGHTPACVTFKIEDAIFTGDTLFMEDYGTGRCDFPKGDAASLYDSVTDRLYVLPDETRVFVGHDYQPKGRELKFETTIGKSKESNIQLKADTTKETFVEFRENRDSVLQAPVLIYPSIQVNIDAGHLPSKEKNGARYLKAPINGLDF